MSAVQILGLLNFERALAGIPAEWRRVEREILKKIADEGARRSQSRARGLGGVHALAAGALAGRARASGAHIGINAGRSAPMANVAFWGAKRRTGWYAAGRYAQSTSTQHPPWIGNAWDVAVTGEGPYAINDALAEYLPELLEEFGDGFDEVAHPAFPL